MANDIKKSEQFEERLLYFSQDVVSLCKKIDQDTISKPIISQIVRSATSIGANYCEANNASSRKDFKNKIFICKKEAQETKYWFKILKTTDTNLTKNIDELLQEAHEFCLIFQKTIATMEQK